MIKFKAKTKDAQLRVRAKLSFDENINFAELDAFSRKLIKGFLRPKQIKKRVIEFTGPIGIPISSRFQNPISKHDFFLIIEQIVDSVQKLNKNKFAISNVVWNINHSYINEATREIQLIYLPGTSLSFVGSVTDYFESIVYLTKPETGSDTEFASNFLYFIRNLKAFNPVVIENYIKRVEPSAVKFIKKHNVGSSGFMTDKQRDYLTHYDEEDEATGLMYEEDEATGLMYEEDEATGLMYEEDEATGLMYEEDEATGLLQDDEATGLLVDETAANMDDDATGFLDDIPQIHFPTLFRVFTNETIQVNKPVFRIGKEKSFVDYFVSNNNAVSRSHADIITRGQRYFVIDLNSKNKTYINGQPLPIQQECEIFNGNQLRLANEEFVFYV